ncbi:hypothetical protein Sste5346_008637 [Sporothrix stenoceras]|uniref:Uncharacterized protein n=1 Tax=Sporothrix stenoceras TaxID=5173 RepID=A0ABR3YPJ1_9PEZI
MPGSGYPVSQLFPPPPPPPSRWDGLPDAMKLILVKELTSWYSYHETIQLLRLTADQERAFRDLYKGELAKQKHFDKAIRARIEARDRELFGNWPYTSLDKPAPSHARAQAQGQADGQERDPIVPGVPRLDLLTDYITVQNLKMAEEYLVAIGFEHSWVDLGHWTGHSGTSRFEIELGQIGHHQRACESGSQGMGELQRRSPEPPNRLRLAQLQQQSQALAQAQAHARAQSQARARARAHGQASAQAHSQAWFQVRSSPRLSSNRLLSSGGTESSHRNSNSIGSSPQPAEPVRYVEFGAATQTILGASLHDILTRLKAEPQRFPKLDLTYSPTDPVRDPIILALPANGLRLRFDGPDQRLRLIEILDFTKNHIFFREQNKDRDLVKPSSADAPAPTSGPTFRHIYSRFLGPTYDGEFVPGEGNGSEGGTYVLSYPGVAFTFPMAKSAYSPDKDVVTLLSTPSNLAAVSMAVFSGDSWAQARENLWTEVLPAVKSFAPLAKGKDVAPDEVSLINIHGGGKLQLFRRWAQGQQLPPASASGPGQRTSSADDAASVDASSSFWITLGETTPQELVAELGPPDAIYRKSDQRMYIHKIRTASNSRSRRPTNSTNVGGLGTSDPHSYNAGLGRRPDDPLTDTDQSSIPTASSDDDDDEAIEEEFVTGNVSSECFFNYFYLGFDVLVSTPATPSRPSPRRTGDEQDAQGSVPPPERPLKTEAPDRLVATKLVLHGNVPGSYPFNRHRRCRWSIAYANTTGGAPPINAETPFSLIEEQLHAAWRSIYSSDEEARQRQRGMVLNRGWGDSPGSSIELLGGWEESQRVAEGRGGRGGGAGGGGGDPGGSTLRGVKGTEDSTTTLYGFPGLVFEILRNGYVSALTVF